MAVSKSSLLPGETGVNAGTRKGRLNSGVCEGIISAIDRVRVGAVGFAKDGRRMKRNGKFY
jgi:S1-C subfamily serine protease